VLDVELTWRDDVTGAFEVSDTVGHAWQVRRSEPELLAAVDQYFAGIYRGTFYNLTTRKYFGNPRSARAYATRRAARAGAISPYDETIKRYAARFDFDWLTLASQMYQESRFDPNVVSFAGAVGLMQLMPQTARGFGFDSLHVPEINIHAGSRYLRHVYGLLDDVPDSAERLWFALASYNAGYGHIQDARRIAEQQGKDPNVWFGNVAEVAPLLMRRAVHRQTKYGYCRCNEPVDYVRKVRDRERAYAAAQRR
jgi:membrane-bound lytic murein transglycosylase F